jgi:class 3 adenylate cyclase
MHCQICNHDNRVTAKFCEACGSILELQCAHCHTPLQQGAKFCDACGQSVGAQAPQKTVEPSVNRREIGRPAPAAYTPKHLADKILQSRSALEGERKQITVLFADVKGSMELAEQLDPEEWHDILERFFAILTEGVHRFEGTVNQYTGDGIMALFGAPIAHEDHAQRACYAALHLRDTLRTYGDELRVTRGLNFGFRIGMNSGEVVVGRIGDDLRMDYTAQGHTVGLAQRMEALADSRSIVLSAYTARFVDGYFALRDLGQMRIKGMADEQHVFELEGLGTHRTRLDTSRARGLSRFVGRGDEMGTLKTALQRSLEGTGRVAAVVGEPGVGKSRLCAEFVDHCRAQGLRVFEAHCPAHGKAIPYLPLLELLRNLFGVTDQDGPREARQKIAGELALLDDAFADDRAMVLDFLGVADPNMPLLKLEPVVRQRRLFAFLRRLIQRRTEAEPLVILIDDLHWIDPGSDLFVAQIVEAVSSTRTLLLVNFRPEYSADWTRKSWVLQLPMAPLGAQALAELVRDWVGARPSVSTLPALVGTRSGGNPFFAEEIVLTLLDTGKLVGTRGDYELNAPIESLDVPATVVSLLASRIDRLSERDKQVLYTAAVVGKEFARPLLEAVLDLSTDDLDAALSALLNAEMINERSLYPVAEYSFKHPLTHEVALHAQLGSARRGRHAQVATAIEASSPDQLDERAGLLAHHWQEAGEPLHAARWHVRAARWVRANDLSAAHRHWAQARELLLPLPDAQERTQQLLAVYPELINLLDRLGAEPSVAEAIYAEGIAFARHSGSRVTEALLEAAYGYLLTAKGEWARVLECGMRAVALAEQEGDVAVAVFGRFVAGRAHGWSGRPRELLAVLDPVALLFDGDEGWDLEVLGWPVYAEALSIRSNAHALLGQPLVSRAFTDRLSAQLRRPGHAQDLTSAACDRIYAALATSMLRVETPRRHSCSRSASDRRAIPHTHCS